MSYEQMRRIRTQVLCYPQRLRWTLDVGNFWKVRRNGDSLLVFKEDQNGRAHSLASEESIPWVIFRTEPETHAMSTDDDLTDVATDTMELCFDALPACSENSRLVTKRVKDIGNVTFVPPWRKGKSAIKVKEFLRGQKVPLQYRDDAVVLCLSCESSIQVLAVYVEGDGESRDGHWVVHADFQHQQGLPVVKVILRKRRV